MIPGIGPAFLKKLTDEGVGLADMAEWTAEDVDRWNEKLGKSAKIREDRWVENARALLESAPPPAPQEEPAAPEPAPLVAPAKGRQQVIAEMKSRAPEPAGEDRVSGMTREELEDLVRKQIGQSVPVNPTAGLQKRGSTAHLHRSPDLPTVVPFDRTRNVLRRLDRNKKFANVIGDHYGAHYSQKGRFFDHEGIEIPFNPNGRPMNAGEIAELYVEDQHVVDDPDEVNLSNWYERKVDYPLDLVKKAVQRIYRKRFETERLLRGFLHQVLRGNQ